MLFLLFHWRWQSGVRVRKALPAPPSTFLNPRVSFRNAVGSLLLWQHPGTVWDPQVGCLARLGSPSWS